MDEVKAGSNPIELRRYGYRTKELVNKLVDNISINVDTNEQIKQVETISANGDQTIGDMIGEGNNQVGRDGVITVEKVTQDDELEIVEGLEFDKLLITLFY